MRFNKLPLADHELAKLLILRGMQGSREVIETSLQSVGYYRLSGYWFTFRQKETGRFVEGTSFDEVWARYQFDRQLRMIVLEAIERFEVAIRCWLGEEHAKLFGPFDYALNPLAIPNLRGSARKEWLRRVKESYEKSREEFATHFREKYGDFHSFLPVWMATETMSFGTLNQFFQGCSSAVTKPISLRLAVHDNLIISWLDALHAVRNICAHHGRLWNRVLGSAPKIPKYVPRWNVPVKVGNQRLFGILTILTHALTCIDPAQKWSVRLLRLVEEYPAIQLVQMGFPDNWEKCPIWSVALEV